MVASVVAYRVEFCQRRPEKPRKMRDSVLNFRVESGCKWTVFDDIFTWILKLLHEKTAYLREKP